MIHAEPAEISRRVGFSTAVPDRHVLKALRNQLCCLADRLGRGLLA